MNKCNGRFCINCKHFGTTSLYEECSSPKLRMRFDRIAGKNKPVYSSCHVQRENGWLWCRINGTCGKSGRFYEATKGAKK